MLTSKRLAFVALVPSHDSNAESHKQSPSNDDDAADVDAQRLAHEIIRQGPAVVHFTGWKRRRHTWVELRKDSIVAYRDSTTKYNPRGAGRLADMEVKPLHFSLSGKPEPQTKKVHISGRGGVYAFEFRTHEAANAWHKDLVAAIWACKKARSRIRVCVPLERLVDLVKTDYRHFLNFKLKVETNDESSAADGADSSVAEVELGILRAYSAFAQQLEQSFEASQNARGSDTLVRSQQLMPVLEIEGAQEKSQALMLAASQDDAHGLAAKLVDLFALRTPPDELKIIKAHLAKTITIAGTLAVSRHHLVFYRHRLPPFRDVMLKIPLTDIVGASDNKTFHAPHRYAIKLQIRGHPSIGFEFVKRKQRDLVMTAMHSLVQDAQGNKQKELQQRGQSAEESDSDDDGQSPVDHIQTMLEPVSKVLPTTVPHSALNRMPKLVNMEVSGNISIEPMRIVCLTIGSRGDVQPYIALCKRLKEEGHSPCIVSHPEYKDWVEKHGIDFRGAGGDPGALMKLSVEHRLFSPAFFKESLGKFRSWLDELLRECYEQCWDAELLIESPSTMAGIHVAEAYQCYYFRAFTMPWTSTKYLPQAFSVPPIDLGEAYNISSYALFDRVFWQATSGQINRWRRYMLGLAPTDFAELDQESVPFIYNFSPAVVPHPIDWSDNIAVTGYWFLSSSSEGWEAPQELQDFIAKAKQEGQKIAYIGFGSITVPDAEKVTHNIYEAVSKSGIRAIVAKGWSDRMSNKDGSKEVEKPPECVYVVDSIPHDWLFPQIDIALHHGGAGTTGASLRAGLVTLIKPWFGDQFFWSGRIQKLGAGLKVTSLNVDDLTYALKTAAKDRIMVEKAADVGARIRAEDGVGNAIEFIVSRISSSTRKYHPLKKKDRAKACKNVAEHVEAELSSSDEEEEERTAKEVEDEAKGLQRDMSLLEKVRAVGAAGSLSPIKGKSQAATVKKQSRLRSSSHDTKTSIPEGDENGKATPPSTLVEEPEEMGPREEASLPASPSAKGGATSGETHGKRSNFLSMPSLPHIPGLPNPHLPTLGNMHLIDAFKAYIPGFDSDELEGQSGSRPCRRGSGRRQNGSSEAERPGSPSVVATLTSKLPGPLKKNEPSPQEEAEEPRRSASANDAVQKQKQQEEQDQRKYKSAKAEDCRRRALMQDKLKKREEMLQQRKREREGQGEEEREQYRREMEWQRQ